jgi:diadenosine tetraphosphatase ApaH/serine/threonine PP2A family protein phosphatase
VRYLIISDVHANLHALEATLADAARIGYDAVLCLGDLVGYGAHPGAAIDRVLALSPVGLIRGNHDKVCCGLEAASRFNEDARFAAEWTRHTLGAEHLSILAGLRRGPQRITDELEICHGSPRDEDQYVFDQADAKRALSSASARICLYGHTHLPAVFSAPQYPVEVSRNGPDDELTLPSEGPLLINVGSVGQPRDGDPRAAYGVLDLDRRRLRLRRVAYDVAGAQAAIRAAGLPPWLASRLARGE